MKVLVAVDDSDLSKQMIEEITTRQWNLKTQFLILNVVALPTADYWQDWGLSVWPELKEKLIAESESLVHKHVAYLNEKLGPEFSVESKVVEGHTCDSIIQIAKEWHADLIMVASHGRSGIEKFFLGSVAEGLLIQSPCSLEIIKIKSKAPGNKGASAMSESLAH